MIQVGRILTDLDAFSRIGGESNGTTRLAYSTAWRTAQLKAKSLLEDAGMRTYFDAVGNLIATKNGTNSNLPMVAMGSHVDTVSKGGNFDGVMGVVAAIEVVRSISEEGIDVKRGLQVISFACEEATRYGVGCLGSKIMTGEVDSAYLDKLADVDGVHFKEALTQSGFTANNLISASRKKGELSAYLELHIEQGPILDREKEQIGVVTRIAAPTRIMITCKGETGHVGTVPMHMRHDALSTAAEIILEVEKTAMNTQGLGVASVGRTEIYPNAVTSIPGNVKLWVDMRCLDDETKQNAIAQIARRAKEIGSRRNVPTEVNMLTQEDAIALSSRIVGAIEESAQALGCCYRKMPSGAMHDAAHMTRITDVGMIFIPCRSGISHSPDEHAAPKNIEAGSRVLERTVLKLANE